MRYNPIRALFIYVVAVAMFSGCTGTAENKAEEENSQTHLVHITHDQFKAEQMELGDALMHTFTQVYKTNGMVTASPQSKADVYSYISGIVRSVYVNPGARVQKGQKLCAIESKQFITLQKQYLEALAKLKATRLDYERIRKLYEEKISSRKDFIAIESKYEILVATKKALTAELKILNVDIQKLEDGNLSMYLPVVSPIDGNIILQNCNIGQFVDSQELLMKIVNNKDLQLHFFVYQENVNKLHPGQLLKIYTPDNTKKDYTAKIINVGKSIDPVTKSIECLAAPDNNIRKIFVDGMYFQVEVNLDTLDALGVPASAILKSGDNRYVLVKEREDEEGLYFRREKVKTGIVSDGFTQILSNKPLRDVLIKGTYFFKIQ